MEQKLERNLLKIGFPMVLFQSSTQPARPAPPKPAQAQQSHNNPVIVPTPGPRFCVNKSLIEAEPTPQVDNPCRGLLAER